MNKKNKNQQIILFIIVGLVIVIALLIPYTTDNNNDNTTSLSVSALTCDSDNKESEHETSLTRISCEEYNNIVNGEEEKLVLYARPTCGFCNKFVPILEEISSEYGIEVNYFDTDILSNAETQEFYSSSPLMSGNEFGTPTLVIIKNGKIINYSVGYQEKEQAVEWLKDNNIIVEQ